MTKKQVADIAHSINPQRTIAEYRKMLRTYYRDTHIDWLRVAQHIAKEAS